MTKWLERVYQHRDISSDLSRRSGKELFIAAAESPKGGPSLLPEPNQDLFGFAIHDLAHQLDLHRAGAEPEPITRRARARIEFRHPRPNDESAAAGADFAARLFLQPTHECGLD